MCALVFCYNMLDNQVPKTSTIYGLFKCYLQYLTTFKNLLNLLKSMLKLDSRPKT